LLIDREKLKDIIPAIAGKMKFRPVIVERVSLTEEWKEFDEQVQALAKITVDSLKVIPRDLQDEGCLSSSHVTRAIDADAGIRQVLELCAKLDTDGECDPLTL